jgi:hypothetical protein
MQDSPAFRQTRMIVKFAFMAAVVIYIILTKVMVFTGRAGDVHIFSIVLTVVYVLILLASPIIERMQSLPLQQFMIRMACRETGAIFGLVLTFISHDPKYVLYFGIPAFLLLAIA